MSRNDNGASYFGFPSASLLMRCVWFNCNWIFSGFEFIFSNLDEFEYCYSCSTPDRLYLKNNFYYFILYFNINNNNN